MLFGAVFCRFDDPQLPVAILEGILPLYDKLYGKLPAFHVRACLSNCNEKCLRLMVQGRDVDWTRDAFPKSLVGLFPPLDGDDPRIRVKKFIELDRLFKSHEEEQLEIIDLALQQ